MSRGVAFGGQGRGGVNSEAWMCYKLSFDSGSLLLLHQLFLLCCLSGLRVFPPQCANFLAYFSQIIHVYVSHCPSWKTHISSRISEASVLSERKSFPAAVPLGGHSHILLDIVCKVCLCPSEPCSGSAAVWHPSMCQCGRIIAYFYFSFSTDILDIVVLSEMKSRLSHVRVVSAWQV